MESLSHPLAMTATAINGPPIPVEVIITLTKNAAPHKVYLCLIAGTDRFNAKAIPKNIINKAMDILSMAGLELARINIPTGTPINPKMIGATISL